jgi:glycosyltransferase involved in cell wall biosynthesis
MKVIYSIGTTLNGGGIGNVAYRSVCALENENSLKKVICSGKKNIGIPKKKISSLYLHKYLIRYPLRLVEKIFPSFPSFHWIDKSFDLLSTNKIESSDIFHSWRNHSLISGKKAKKLGAKIVVENASSHPLIQKKLLEEEYKANYLNFKAFNKKSLKRSLEELNQADYIKIPSDFVEKSFLEMGFKKEKLIKIPFGVDLINFNTKKEKIDKKFRAIFVGQVTLRKGIHYLLKAWDELKLENAELIIIGNICSDAESIVEKYKKNKSILFKGHQDSKKEYKYADVFVFPSIEEGSALVSYEAMASGLPVIVTFNTGSVARDGKDGFIIPIRDVKILKEKIKYFYDNPKEIFKMGQSARKNIENFTWDRHNKKLMEFYKKIQ